MPCREPIATSWFGAAARITANTSIPTTSGVSFGTGLKSCVSLRFSNLYSTYFVQLHNAIISYQNELHLELSTAGRWSAAQMAPLRTFSMLPLLCSLAGRICAYYGALLTRASIVDFGSVNGKQHPSLRLSRAYPKSLLGPSSNIDSVYKGSQWRPSHHPD